MDHTVQSILKFTGGQFAETANKVKQNVADNLKGCFINSPNSSANRRLSNQRASIEATHRAGVEGRDLQ